MLKIIFLIIVLIAIFAIIPLRVSFTHPISVIRYAFIDIRDYFKYKKWRNAYCGTLTAYIGQFGHGKTLSMVKAALDYYARFNDRIVYVPGRGWLTQKVQILSNVSLNVPYLEFESLQQVVDICENQKQIDRLSDTITYTYCIIDEASVQFNSRDFKTSIDSVFLNSLLTCRHHHLLISYSSQEFHLTDKLLRSVTQHVIRCRKIWRIMTHKVYDAFDYENCSNLEQIKPIARRGWFVFPKYFEAYDTLACVGNLIKSCKAGHMMTEQEILDSFSFESANRDSIVHPSNKEKKYRKK